MQQSYSNWFVSWICSISKLDVIKLMLGFGLWHQNLTKIVVCGGALIYSRYEITRGCKLPLLLFWDKFIKLLNMFIIATIVSNSLPILEVIFVVSLDECLRVWLIPWAQIILLKLILNVSFYLLCCLHDWCTRWFISHMLHLLLILHLCNFFNKLRYNLV